MRRPAAPAPVPWAGAVAERYMADISSRLPGSPRTCSVIVDELRSGLLDAIDAHTSDGLPYAAAVQAAISEFGDPAQVARDFTAEVAAGLARRVAVAVLVSGPLVGILWVATAVSGHLVPHLSWAGLPPGIGVGIALVGVAAGVTTLGALLSIAATGRLIRWLPVRPLQAPAAAAAAGFGAVGADGMGLMLLVMQLVTAPAHVPPVLASAAAATSVVRLVLARRAARRCLAIRSDLAW